MKFYIIIMGAAALANALQVTPSDDGTQLANAVLGVGLKLVPGSAKYVGAKEGSGTFTDGPQGIRDAAVLTSGLVMDTVPKGTSVRTKEDDFSRPAGTAGNDVLCGPLSGGVYKSLDAAVLTMEVQLDTEYDGVAAQFVFATEEYPHFIDQEFNDVFGVYIDGKQIAFDDKHDPITVNGPFFSTGNVLLGPQSGSAYNGSTPLLTSGTTATGGKHKVQIVICDTADNKRDSSVFIALNACKDGDCKEGTKIVKPKPKDNTTATTTGGIPASTGGVTNGNGTNGTYPPQASEPPVYTGAAATVGTSLVAAAIGVAVAMMSL
jgi:hypothetical protein